MPLTYITLDSRLQQIEKCIYLSKMTLSLNRWWHRWKCPSLCDDTDGNCPSLCDDIDENVPVWVWCCETVTWTKLLSYPISLMSLSIHSLIQRLLSIYVTDEFTGKMSKADEAVTDTTDEFVLPLDGWWNRSLDGSVDVKLSLGLNYRHIQSLMALSTRSLQSVHVTVKMPLDNEAVTRLGSTDTPIAEFSLPHTKKLTTNTWHSSVKMFLPVKEELLLVSIRHTTGTQYLKPSIHFHSKIYLFVNKVEKSSKIYRIPPGGSRPKSCTK